MQSQSRQIRLLVVDDQEIVREGLRSVISNDPGILIVGEAETSAQAVSQALMLEPDVVLLDVRLPDGSGIGACRTILRTSPQMRILFLTSYFDEDAELAAIVEGARGYLLKEEGSIKLIESIKAVAAGKSVWSGPVTN